MIQLGRERYTVYFWEVTMKTGAGFLTIAAGVFGGLEVHRIFIYEAQEGTLGPMGSYVVFGLLTALVLIVADRLWKGPQPENQGETE